MAVERSNRSLAIVLAAFFLGVALHWPAVPLYRDEVGYIGQARLLLEGRFRPRPTSVVYAFETDRGPEAAYPYALPVLLAPLLAVTPRAVFALNLGATVLLVVGVARIFERWGRSPLLAAALLAHPTILILSRTAMADIVLTAAAVWAWLALERGERAMSFLAFAALVLAKPHGVLIAAALLVGAVLRKGASFRPPLVGVACGAAAALGLNVVSTGGLAYAYADSSAGFGAEYLAEAGSVNLLLLLLAPPGLVLGGIPLVRRRAWGLFLGAAVVVAFFCVYSHTDRGRSLVETLVLGPRMILPAAVFLLIGWLDGVAGIVARVVPLRGERRWTTAAVACSMFVAAFVSGAILERRGATMREALDVAERTLADHGGGALALGDAAYKAGILARVPVVAILPGASRPVVLCGRSIESLRRPMVSTSCDLPGFRVAREIGNYRVLVRDEARDAP